MPRVTPLAEVDQLEPDQEIIMVRGKITKLFKAHRGDSDDGGQWSFQSMTLKDNTGERKVLVKNRPEDVPMNWRGKDVVIEAHKGEKGWSGVYAMDEEYPKDSGKFTRIIKVTPTAGIFLADAKPETEASAGQTTAGNGQSRASAPRGTAGATRPASEHPADPADRVAGQKRAILDAKKKAARLANLFTIAVDAVENVIVPHVRKIDANYPTAEQHQAAIATLFIPLQRDGMADGLPVKTLADFVDEQKQPPPPAKPEPKPEPPPSAQSAAENLGWDEDDTDEIPF